MNEIETFFGPIEGTADALRVFELCRQGRLGRVRRRLYEKERKLIRSGSVFVFDEQESGVRRWTDGRLWSPSRILGNFLIYRELERRVVNNNNNNNNNNNVPMTTRKTTATMPNSTKSDSDDNVSNNNNNNNMIRSMMFQGGTDSFSESLGTASPISPSQGSSIVLEMNSVLPWLASPILPDDDTTTTMNAAFASLPTYGGSIDPNKLDFNSRGRLTSISEGCASSFIGPNSFRLLNSKKLQASAAAQNGQTRYVFKPDGLIKKTISAKVDGRMQHLVCYFSEADFIVHHSTNSMRPGKSTDPLMEELRKTRIPADLVLQQNFRKQPATELGFPLCNTSGVVRRRHSVHFPTPSSSQLPASSTLPLIYPRLTTEEITTIESFPTSWSQLTSSALDDYQNLLPELADTDQLFENHENLNLINDFGKSLSLPPPPPPSSSSLSLSSLPPLSLQQQSYSLPPPLLQSQSSNNSIMDECIKMVLGRGNSAFKCGGMNAVLTCDHDPTLPVIRTPDHTSL